MESSSGSSGTSLPGESSNSLLYLLAARLKEPHMPPNGGKIADPKLALIKLWIDQGSFPTASGKPMVKKKSSVNLALGSVTLGKRKVLRPCPSTCRSSPALFRTGLCPPPWRPPLGPRSLRSPDKTGSSLPYQSSACLAFFPSRKVSSSLCPSAEMGKSYSRAGDEEEKRTGRRMGSKDCVDTLGRGIRHDSYCGSFGRSIARRNRRTFQGESLRPGEWGNPIKSKALRMGHSSSILPDGILLATGDRNGGLYVWEARTGNAFCSPTGTKKPSLILVGVPTRTLCCPLRGCVREDLEMINGKQAGTWNVMGSEPFRLTMTKRQNHDRRTGQKR